MTKEVVKEVDSCGVVPRGSVDPRGCGELGWFVPRKGQGRAVGGLVRAGKGGGSCGGRGRSGWWVDHAEGRGDEVRREI